MVLARQLRNTATPNTAAHLPDCARNHEDYLSVRSSGGDRPVRMLRGKPAGRPPCFLLREQVLPLMDEMRKTGSVIWSGNTSDDNVMRQIEASQLFCLMCSADAYASDHVRRELLIASHFGKPVLPILLDGAVMPDDIEHFIGELQSVDMTEVNLENRSELIRGAITA